MTRDTLPSPPPASGVRLPWEGLPAWLRGAIEEQLGARVVAAVTQTGGFSPGVAARLRLDDGRRAFVKAIGPEPNPTSPGFHRAEIRVASALPETAPVPRFLGSLDQEGWVALLFEDIEGTMPAQPWRHDELERVLGAVADLAAALTPSPITLPGPAERLGDSFHGWRQLVEAHERGEDRLSGLDPWALRHLHALAGLEAGWAAAAAGETLVHSDLRADNLLLTPERVVVVDWPHALIGAPWFDLLCMLPSVHMQGGPVPETIFGRHPVAAGADPESVTAVLAALAGYFVRQSRQPPPPGLPTVRAFQAAQGETALAWLRRRIGWE
jgi:aminoglycoside phosphotransferase (APT) family kinase protein